MKANTDSDLLTAAIGLAGQHMEAGGWRAAWRA